MQNYALQQVLIRLGHTPVTLRFPTEYQGKSEKEIWKDYFIRVIKYCAKFVLRRKCRFPQNRHQWRKQTSAKEMFIREKINVTDFISQLDDSVIDKYELNCLVVGSDQVWRPVYVKNLIGNYFCGFLKTEIKKISYAASFGTDKWEYSDNEEKETRKLIRKFKGVSVREKSAVELCKDHFGIKASWVLDPTMLLLDSDYSELCKDIPHRNESYVLTYFLDSNHVKHEYAKIQAQKLGCKTISVSKNDSVENWLSLFRDADYIVTDSFHGTAFSVIYNRQFTCFYNEKRGNSRIYNFKYLLEDSAKGTTFLGQNILECASNKDRVNYIIEKMREDSINFLRQNL